MYPDVENSCSGFENKTKQCFPTHQLFQVATKGEEKQGINLWFRAPFWSKPTTLHKSVILILLHRQPQTWKVEMRKGPRCGCEARWRETFLVMVMAVMGLGMEVGSLCSACECGCALEVLFKTDKGPPTGQCSTAPTSPPWSVWKRNRDLLFYLLIHSFIAPCMGPAQGSDLQPWHIGQHSN